MEVHIFVIYSYAYKRVSYPERHGAKWATLSGNFVKETCIPITLIRTMKCDKYAVCTTTCCQERCTTVLQWKYKCLDLFKRKCWGKMCLAKVQVFLSGYMSY